MRAEPGSAPPAPRAPLGLILAAGGSRRMGQPKALLELDGRPLIRHHVEALQAVGAEVAVVLGAEAPRLAAALPSGLRWVNNPDWATTGPRESLALLLAALDPPAARWVLVTPVDVPPAPLPLLQALLAAGAPAVPTFAGEDGHPVLARAGALREGLARGTLRDAMADAPRRALPFPDLVRNLNLPAEWAAWRAGRAR